MDVENTPMTNDELQHWGIKGMKWGIRRFQKKDGSLTPAGRKRYDDDGDGGGDSGGNRGSRQSGAGSGKKKLSEMTDEELQKAINRARMEDTYRQLRPEKESTGKRLMRSMINDAAIPAAVGAGKKLMQQALEKYGGNLLKDAVDPNSVEAMKATLEKLELGNKIRIARDGITSDSKAYTFEDANKRQQLIRSEYEFEGTKRQDAEDATPGSAADIKKQAEIARNKNELLKAEKNTAKIEADAKADQAELKARETKAKAEEAKAKADKAEAKAREAEAKAKEKLAKENVTQAKKKVEDQGYDDAVDAILDDMDAKGWETWSHISTWGDDD